MGTQEKMIVPDYLRGENQWETDANLELYEAAVESNLDKLRNALSQGGNPNFFHRREEQGVLHVAARSPSKDAALCAKELIRKGARVSAAVISNRNTAIHEAACSGSREVCKLLIESSPNCTEHQNSFGNTALHTATRSGHSEIVRLLLENSADPNKINHRGSTSLHIACFLASVGDDAIDSDSTNLNKIDPYFKIVAILLCDNRLNIDIQDVNGYTALHIAAHRGCETMVKLLIDSGASLTAKTGIDSKGRGGRDPTGMARFGGHEKLATIINEFAKANDRGETVAKKKMALEMAT